MWMDQTGVAHTAAVPQPETFVDASFLTFLVEHRDDFDDDFRDALEEESISAFAAANDRPANKLLKRQPLPAGLAIGANFAPSEQGARETVAYAIAQLPVEWRLDAALVLGDVLDEQD